MTASCCRYIYPGCYCCNSSQNQRRYHPVIKQIHLSLINGFLCCSLHHLPSILLSLLFLSSPIFFSSFLFFSHLFHISFLHFNLTPIAVTIFPSFFFLFFFPVLFSLLFCFYFSFLLVPIHFLLSLFPIL